MERRGTALRLTVEAWRWSGVGILVVGLGLWGMNSPVAVAVEVSVLSRRVACCIDSHEESQLEAV